MWRAFRVFVTVERSVVNKMKLFLLSHPDLTSFSSSSIDGFCSRQYSLYVVQERVCFLCFVM